VTVDLSPSEVQARIRVTLMSALITKTPDVCGGSACIVRTRLAVWFLQAARKWGATNEEIIRSYPVLRQVDLEAAWAYVYLHPEEIERAIAENNAEEP
jgi:uncharacterized protein (DUF433 family)